MTTWKLPTVGSLANSGRVWALSFPLMARCVLLSLTTIYLLSLSNFQTLIRHLCLQPNKVLEGVQVHRLATYSLLHGSFLHLLGNCLTWCATAHDLEKHLGTIDLAYCVAMYTVLIGIAHATSSFLLYQMYFSFANYHSCTVGFSGVLFALLTVHVYKYSTATNLTIFGRLTVPTTVYPWLLLGLTQLLLPHVSFLCHLSGILFGYAQVHGFTEPLLARPETLKRWERSWLVRQLSKFPGFMPIPGGLPVPVASPTGFKMPGKPKQSRKERLEALYEPTTEQVLGTGLLVTGTQTPTGSNTPAQSSTNPVDVAAE